jgi:hypothetical protein
VPIPSGTSGWLVALSRRPTAQRGPTATTVAGPPRCWLVGRCTEVTRGCRRLQGPGRSFRRSSGLTPYGFSPSWSTRVPASAGETALRPCSPPAPPGSSGLRRCQCSRPDLAVSSAALKSTQRVAETVPIPSGTSGWLVAPSRRPTAQRGPTATAVAGPPRCWLVRRCTEVTRGCRRPRAAGAQLSPFLRRSSGLTPYGFSPRGMCLRADLDSRSRCSVTARRR